MKTKLHKLLMLILLFSACKEDLKIKETDISDMDYILPQGGDPIADQRIIELYHNYDSYFLYEFTEKDFIWTLVSKNDGKAVYRFDPIQPSAVTNLLDLLQISWFDFYEPAFLKRNMPKHVFLAENVQLRIEKFNWATWEYEFSWENAICRYLNNQLAIGNVKKKVEEMSDTEKRGFKSYLQASFLEYCLYEKIIALPREFYALSDYTANLKNQNEEAARQAGFVYNPKTGLEWSTRTSEVNQTDDAAAYLSSLVYRTDEEWEKDLEYPLVKKKYEISVHYLTEQYGIDVCKIGNTIYK